MATLIDRLREIGLGDYEARLYLALVKRHPATGYELARSAGVPSSKVYEVLGRLQEKDLVFVTDGGGRGKRYVPVDPEELIERYRTRLTQALDGLRDDLEAIGVEEPVGYIWNVHGRPALLDRTTQLIARADHTLLLSGWDEELVELASAITAAHQRKVRVAVIDYGTLALEAAAVYTHPIKDTIHGEKGGRGLTLCADSRVALMGLVQDDGGAHGAWSRNRAFVAAAEDYLKHDIYVQKIVGRFHDLLVRTYGPNFTRSRDVFSDRVVAPRPTKRRASSTRRS
jgi:HTH-type transcriptional regulator, sugar sensing transcriptional regulator